MIVILDYGMGNTASILNMITHIGGEATISHDKNILDVAKALILPGVGAFDNAMERIIQNGLLGLLRRRVVDEGIPVLGICLGMQLLFEKSEEGKLEGLGLIPGEVKRFFFHDDKNKRLKIPHMGWNVVNPINNDPIFESNEKELRFYFVHSYHAVCDDKYISAITNYSYDFPCAVRRGHIFGVQFHPEKSHQFGMRFFENFIKLTC